ncbi:hypothetical protein B5F83_02900 [Muribaculum sp. An289]|uniref:hypothetical protein n=1 Tax=unclassified Muribaculum TaxID=2622126 RepID=UPI000B3A5886|nr:MULTISPECIES: hypothetical protein [unclassified Muribaculum]OUO37668.1 hypothetical protein B5F83_02900 [Muribaculum sp. An289]OUO41592.1 hypothetical protein B5F81_09255 [Muribaculum sp. An287]
MYEKLFYIVAALLLLTSCGAGKRSADVSREKGKSLEGDKVMVETVRLHGIDEAEVLNEDGTKLIKMPFKWYAGIGTADNKQVAIELAQREAYATISRVLNNIVQDQAQRGNLANNGKVQQALSSYWEQISVSVQNACEPFGETVIEYNPSTGMYNVTAKVGIRGDRFNDLLDTAGKIPENELDKDELDEFIDINKSIMEAAKGI